MPAFLSKKQGGLLAALAFLALCLRLVPRYTAQMAGRSAYLAPLFALPLLLLFVALVGSLQRRRREGESLAGLVLRVFGRRAGGALLLVFVLWCLCYGLFALCSCTNFFVSTMYGGGRSALFVLILGLLGLLAATKSVKVLGRTAELVAPFFFLMLVFICFAACRDTRFSLLLPLEGEGALRAATASWPIFEPGFFVILLSAFFIEKGPSALWPRGRLLLYCFLGCGFLALVSAATLARFGSELVGNSVEPFFVLLRSLKAFGSVERLESLVVALWIFPDFIMVGLCLLVACSVLRELYCRPLPALPWLLGAALILPALFLAPKSGLIRALSLCLVPAVNLSVCVLFPLVVLVGAKIKKGK